MKQHEQYERAGAPACRRVSVSEEWARGWKVALGAGLGMASGASAIIYTSSLFIPALQDAFGWTRAQVSAGALGIVVAAFAGPVIGRITDIYGARRVLLSALTLQGMILLVLASMPMSLAGYYVVYTLLMITTYGSTGITGTRAISSWFDASLGRALALSRVLITVFAVILPPVLTSVMHHYGVRGGYVALASACLLIGLPAAWGLVSERKEGTSLPGKPRVPLARVFRERKLPILIVTMLLQMPIMAIVGHLAPILKAKGISPETGAILISLFGGASFGGVLLGGLLLDRIGARLIGLGLMFAAAFGVGILALDTHELWIAIFAVLLIGLSQGIEVDIVGYLVCRYFYHEVLSMIYGISATTYFITAGIGISIYGYAFDYFKSYQYVMFVSMGVLSLGGLAFLLFGSCTNSGRALNDASHDKAGLARPLQEVGHCLDPKPGDM